MNLDLDPFPTLVLIWGLDLLPTFASLIIVVVLGHQGEVI